MNLYHSKKISLSALLAVICIVFLPGDAAAARSSLITPLLYPAETVETDRPWFIWNDIHNTGKKNLFRLTLKETGGPGGKTEVFTFEPSLFYRTYYAFRAPARLTGGPYEYRIEMLGDSKPVKYSYYYYLKYPIEERFRIGKGNGAVDSLPPETLIRYKVIERENTLVNGYNVAFYGASATLTLGIGILFHTVLRFGVVSTIVTYVCYGTSIIGYTAAGTYGFRYLGKRGEMAEILKAGDKTKIKGGVDQRGIRSGAELSF